MNIIMSVYHFLRQIRNYFECVMISIREIDRFKAGKKGLDCNILLCAHSLEKGMSFRITKPNFGVTKADNLCNLLQQYLHDHPDPNTYVYDEGISVLKAYLEFQRQSGTLQAAIDQKISMLKPSRQKCGAGVDILHSEKNFADCEAAAQFLIGRRSIRQFKGGSVSREEMEKIIQIAKHAPSACNRQMVKVYCTSTDESVQAMDDLIPGNTGFKKEIPNYAVITADRSYFGKNEIFQWYVNGGIFTTYFCLSLYALGLGSCIFQWPADRMRDRKLREIAPMGKSECVIAVVGFGKCDDTAKCLVAQRKPNNEILTFI